MTFSPRIKSNALCGPCLLFQPLLETVSISLTRFQLHWLSFQFPGHSKLFPTWMALHGFFTLPRLVFTAFSVWLVILILHIFFLEGSSIQKLCPLPLHFHHLTDPVTRLSRTQA